MLLFTASWCGNVCMTKTVQGTRVVVGEGKGSLLPIPHPRIELPIGEHQLDDFTVKVTQIERQRLPLRFDLGPLAWFIASIAVHAALFTLVFHLRDTSQPHTDITTLSGYLARTAGNDQPHESAVASSLSEQEIDDTVPPPPEAMPQPLPQTTRIARAVSRGGSTSHGSSGRSCAAYAHMPHDPSLSWIEFQLIYEDKTPVVGEPYRVTLPDGTVHEGKTDERGLVCYTAVKKGDAKVEFLRYGRHARYLGPSDKPI